MPVKGAAGIRLADARAAVRNSASRRVIDPVICVLKMRPPGTPEGYGKRYRNTYKTGDKSPSCCAMLPLASYHRSTAQRSSIVRALPYRPDSRDRRGLPMTSHQVCRSGGKARTLGSKATFDEGPTAQGGHS